MVRCAWVFAGGEFDSNNFPIDEVQEDDFFVGVDRGTEYCLSTGNKPNVIVGDLDSIEIDLKSPEQLNDVCHRIYPKKKAASDLELALTHLLEVKPAIVILLGVSGGRTDHMLFNWHLPLLRKWPFQIQYIDSTVRAYVLSEVYPVSFAAELGDIVSVYPLTQLEGVTTAGLEYPLNNDKIELGSTLGLSNTVIDSSIQVSLKKGLAFVLTER